MLRLFLGEGDQYSAWEELPLPSIQWHQMAAPMGFDSEDAVLSFSRRRQLRKFLNSNLETSQYHVLENTNA